ncbi:glycosyltransferase family 18 protein [Calocera cornea HHB12733]|uniref:alpha-1,6-mannosyl-glycoprotein 6-beta-N-acetylglucosaminyltransferase n=1 Tax=Calocera cornea HHB12733 TaxID=1353952 RepID=A0A165EVK9_9BASI|nr:glycosyltransferase family 18 protein [Calocera cornea HHB12733]
MVLPVWSVRTSRIALLGGTTLALLLCMYLWNPVSNMQTWVKMPGFLESTTANPGQSPMLGLFPEESVYDPSLWMDRNMKTMHRLLSCTAAGTCLQNQTKIVLLGDFHMVGTIRGELQGEHVWGRSILAALDELGYSYLFSETNQEVVQQYRMFPDKVVAIILDPQAILECFSNQYCLKSNSNRHGIPFWLLFGFHWWRGAASHPLGERWVISPEHYQNEQVYIGYSIQDACSKRTYIPFHDRPNQAYILAKFAQYFLPEDFLWTNEAFELASKTVDVNFVVGLRDSPAPSADALPPATRNLGPLDQDHFFDAVAHSKVLVGVGHPFLSPSPWDALCVGVPFIQPTLWSDPGDPHDTSKWISQHDPMMNLGEPYAYTVLQGDTEGFVQAMKKALTTPIQPYVHPEMTKEGVTRRMGAFLSFDWRGLGMEILKNRTNTGGEMYAL